MEESRTFSTRGRADDLHAGVTRRDADAGEMSLLPSRRHAMTPRRLLERLADGVVQVKASGAILYLNVAASQLLDAPRAGLEGQHLRAIAPQAFSALLDTRAARQQAQAASKGDETTLPRDITLPNGRHAQLTLFSDADDTWWLLLNEVPQATVEPHDERDADVTSGRGGRERLRVVRRIAPGTRKIAASKRSPDEERAHRRDLRRESHAYARRPGTKKLFEALPVGMLYLRGDSLVMRANETAARIFGVPLHQLEGAFLHSTRWHAITLDGEPLSLAETPIGIALRRGEPVRNELLGIVAGASAEPRWVRMSVTPEPRSSRRTSPFAAVTVEDITDLRNAQLARDRLTRFSRAVTRDLGEGVYALDADGRLAFLNPAGERLLGWSEGELLGKRMHDIIHTHDCDGTKRPQNECALLGVLATGNIAQAEDDVFRRKDGALFPVRFVSSPIWEDNQVVGAVVAFNDITNVHEARAHLLQAQRAQEAQANELATIIETMTEALIVCDREGHIAQANAAARGLLELSPADGSTGETGLTLGEALTRRAHARYANGEPFVWDTSPLSTVFTGATLIAGEDLDLRIAQVNGSEARINLTGAPLRDRNGQIVGAAVTLRDVTADREREIARVEFLNVLAHELRTPLTTVKAQTQLLQRRILKGQLPTATSIEQTLGGIARIERLVNDLLDATRLESGTLVLERAPVDVAQLCQRVADEAKQMGRRDLELIAGDAPVEVTCDAVRIARALNHLLGNALKFSPPESRVTIRVSASAHSVTVSVRDEGPGMTAAVLRQAFSRFYRAPGINVQRGSEVGLGLGLYLARGLIQAHGGTLRADSAPGKGTIVWFTIPRTTEA